jgi:hypothetical protein
MDEQYITEDMLTELGIDLTGQDKIALLAHLNDTLEERIGVEITESLNDVQLKELLDLQESGKDDEITAWLEQHVPDLPEIVSDHIDVLLGELAENADDINKTE